MSWTDKGWEVSSVMLMSVTMISVIIVMIVSMRIMMVSVLVFCVVRCTRFLMTMIRCMMGHCPMMIIVSCMMACISSSCMDSMYYIRWSYHSGYCVRIFGSVYKCCRMCMRYLTDIFEHYSSEAINTSSFYPMFCDFIDFFWWTYEPMLDCFGSFGYMLLF